MSKKLVIEVDHENITEDIFNTYCNAQALHGVIWDILQKLRAEIKHGDDEKKAEYYEELRELIWENINSNGIGGLF